MIHEKRVLALVPARGGSKGLPRKNILPVCGKPLLAWPIEAARGSRYVDRVIISTDDQEMADTALEFGCEVPFIRPAALASDTAPSFGFIRHAVEFLRERNEEYDYLVLLEPTSPLTESSDIDTALEMLEAGREVADSIVGVCKAESNSPVFCASINAAGALEPFGRKDFKTTYRRQDIPELYFFEGTLYISDVRVLLEQEGFVHERTMPYIVPRWKSVEVDELYDLILVEAIMNNLARIKAA